MSSRNRPRAAYDVVVAGARCAGAATAMLLARRGLRVLAVERSRAGSDTLSTHALMRGGVLQLSRWELLDELVAAGTPAVRTTTFHYAEEVLPVRIKARDGIDALYAPRRTLLDSVLVEAARAAGADVVHGARLVELLEAADGRVRGVLIEDPHSGQAAIEADLVVGADGLRSTVARLAGATTYRSGRHAACNVYGYWSGLELDGYHWYYRPGTSVGAIPTNDGLTCVFASAPAKRFENELRRDFRVGYRRVLRECAPDLDRALAGARLVGHLRGFPGSPGHLRQCFGPGWALVGDAGYFRDPITAHGITDALRDAELLARAVASGAGGALAAYQSQRDELVSGFFEATDRIASFEWDLAEVKQLHLAASEEMKREVAVLGRLDAASSSAAPDRAA